VTPCSGRPFDNPFDSRALDLFAPSHAAFPTLPHPAQVGSFYMGVLSLGDLVHRTLESEGWAHPRRLGRVGH